MISQYYTRLFERDIIPSSFSYWKKLSKNNKITPFILLAHSDKPWDWLELSKNKNLTIDVVIFLSDKPWDWYYISKLYFPFELVLKFPNKNWNWCHLSSKKDVNLNIVRKLSDKDWDWHHDISRDKNLTPEMVIEFPDKDWDWNHLSGKIDFVEKLLVLFPNKEWNWIVLSMLPVSRNILDKILEPKNLFSGIMTNVSYNPNINLEFVLKYPQLEWEWANITNISLENILKNLKTFEKVNRKFWTNLSGHRDLTLEIIEKYSNKPWDWYAVSENTNIRNIPRLLKFTNIYHIDFDVIVPFDYHLSF